MGENKEYISNSNERGSINISEEVISVIAGAAATEIEGVFGLYASSGRDFSEIVGKKQMSKGIKISAEDGRVTVELMLLVRMGYSVSEIGKAVQKAVAEAIEAAAGVTVEAVNVHICGISLIKDK